MNVVASSWDIPIYAHPLARLAFKLRRLKAALKSWNKERFGNVHSNVATAEQEVVTLEQLFIADPSDDNHSNLEAAKDKLREVLLQEERYWRQQSGIKWLKEGDRNTEYFHAIAENKKKGSLSDL